jgi:hypothetical protein
MKDGFDGNHIAEHSFFVGKAFWQKTGCFHRQTRREIWAMIIHTKVQSNVVDFWRSKNSVDAWAGVKTGFLHNGAQCFAKNSVLVRCGVFSSTDTRREIWRWRPIRRCKEVRISTLEWHFWRLSRGGSSVRTADCGFVILRTSLTPVRHERTTIEIERQLVFCHCRDRSM